MWKQNNFQFLASCWSEPLIKIEDCSRTLHFPVRMLAELQNLPITLRAHLLASFEPPFSDKILGTRFVSSPQRDSDDIAQNAGLNSSHVY